LTATFKKLWKNEYVQTGIVIGLIIAIVIGFWFGIQLALATPYPVLAVVSGSMCVPHGASCDGWSDPFEHTLHIGDLIVIQGVNPADLNANYPNSDIIVYQDPRSPTDPEAKIVHRIVAKQEIDGKLYFQTKGDGNGLHKWPSAITSSDYDSWNLPDGVPEDQIYGRVIMRIPWIGHIILFMHNSLGLPIIIAIMVLLLFIEFILPLLRKKEPVAKPEQQPETQPQLF
jgi:signal peptidase I